jgi:uncharacterized protein
MSKQIYINLPVTDLARATAFYEALGFIKQPDFSNDKATGLKWSDEIFVMLLRHDFYSKFLKGKSIADATKTSTVLLSLSFGSKEEVQKFADTAKQSGGNYYHVDMGMPEEMMFGYEVQDPDGNSWEPIWMSPNFNTQG